jgi:ABC-type transport system involved in multi-copper enzyme maturation permease subunit
MTAQTAGVPATLDVSGTSAIPFSRLVRLEGRKLVDTRAGRWLLISIAALTALVLVIQLAVVVTQDLHVRFTDFLVAMNTPMGVLLPVLGVMSITSEWSQRTAMVTFTLEPSRQRVVAAKLVSVLGVAVAAVVVGLVLGVIANLLYGAFSGDTVIWSVSARQLLGFLLLHVFGMTTGFAFGMLFLNTPAGIVVYFVYSFVLPGLFELGASLVHWFSQLRPWIDFNAAQTPLIDTSMSGDQWAHLAVSGLLWLVLPLVVGVRRVLRTEVK